jgi:hypothetical protein
VNPIVITFSGSAREMQTRSLLEASSSDPQSRYDKQNEDDRVLHFLGVRVEAVGGEFHGTSPIRGQ